MEHIYTTMRFSLATVPALAALAAALPAPAPQEIDLDAVIAAPDPTYSEAVGVTAQVITLDATAIAAQVTSAVSSVSVDVSDVLSGTAIAKRDNAKRTACAPQPTGVAAYAVGSPDTASAFAAAASFSSIASAASTPSGYSNTFVNLNASNSAYGYLGYTTLSTYDTNSCATKCNAINGCMSFNLYFERDPSVDPGSGCTDPASVTMIKCVFWGGPVSSSNANNYGQYRNQFQIVIAGSNGYTNNSLIVPAGYASPTYVGNAAINAPYDAQGYDTYMGMTIFNSGPFNASLCAAFCDAQSAYNLAHPASDGTPPKVCRFFNTYLLYVNTTAHMEGQYCSLYTEAWDASTYGNNVGQWRGNDHYMVEYSYTYTNSTNAGVKPKTGDKTGAIYQAALDMKYDSNSLTSTFLPFCTSLLSWVIPTATSTVTTTPITTLVVSQITTVTNSAYQRRAASSSTPNVLTKYPSTVLSSACNLVATSPAASLSVVVTATATAAASTTSVTTLTTTTTTVTYANVVKSTDCASPKAYYIQVDNSGTEADGTVMMNVNKDGGNEWVVFHPAEPSASLGTMVPQPFTFDKSSGTLTSFWNTNEMLSIYPQGGGDTRAGLVGSIGLGFQPLTCTLEGNQLINCGSKFTGTFLAGLRIEEYGIPCVAGGYDYDIENDATFTLIPACDI